MYLFLSAFDLLCTEVCNMFLPGKSTTGSVSDTGGSFRVTHFGGGYGIRRSATSQFCRTHSEHSQLSYSLRCSPSSLRINI